MVHTIVPPYSQFVHGGQSNFLHIVFVYWILRKCMRFEYTCQTFSVSFGFTGIEFLRMKQDETKKGIK